uniref:Putative flocculation protein flo11 n=1 Tax=Amblyomma triste TaxID=251400 RepID=A0A023GD40_AMBTT
MSLDRQITDCFKMKKPKSSPPKETSCALTTPKRRLGKSRSTPQRLRSTPNGSNESSPQNCRGQKYDNTPVDLDNLIVEEFLCSQDVVNSDVTWDCSSPRNRLVAANSPGRSDVQSLVKLFRSKPQETKPTTALSIISTHFVTASTLGHAPTSRKKKGSTKKGTGTASSSAQAVMAQVQELWDIVQQSKQNGFLPAVPSKSAPPDTEDAASSDLFLTATEVDDDIVPQEDGARATTDSAAPVTESTVEDEDYDTWLIGDESILAAATQDIEAPSPARKPFKTPTRSSKAQPSPGATCHVPAVSSTSSAPAWKTPTAHSPLQHQDGRSSPNRVTSATRKSPRLSMLLNKTPSPLRPLPVKAEKPAPVKEASPSPLEASSRKSSTEALFEDDDEDEFLDQICCTYEQQQQQEPKVATATVPSLFKAPAPSAVTSSRAAIPAFNSSASAFVTASKSTTVPVSKAHVSKGSVAQCRPADSVTVKKSSPPKEMSSNTLTSAPPVAFQRATSLVASSKGQSHSVAKPVVPSSSRAVDQKPSALARNSLARSVQVLLERCATPPKKAEKRPSPSPPPRVPLTLKLHHKAKSPSRLASLSTSRSENMSVSSTSRTGETGLDFDDDDSDLATPEVMSWLEAVESQPAPVKRCTPEEIAKKRAEALQRRRLREQASNMWKGRLRVSK